MNAGLIFAGGTGTRMSSRTRPKQFLELNGKPIIVIRWNTSRKARSSTRCAWCVWKAGSTF